MSIALRYTQQHADAEEVTNDTFLRAFTHLTKYDPARSFNNWISKIAVNASIDFLRKKKNQLQFLEIDDRTPEASDQAVMEELTLHPDAPILPILQELPPQYRTVFNLYVFEDYKHKDIAVKLNITVGTSKSNYSRAKRIIAEKLKDKKNIDQLLTGTI